MTPAELMEYLQVWKEGPDGAANQRDRIEEMADLACANFEGDLLEIGCLNGGTSVRLADVARDHGRKLICMDSWREDAPYDLIAAKAAFDEVMAPYADVLTVYRLDAHTDEARTALRRHRYAFAFVDDGHEHSQVEHELASILPYTNGLVAADDANPSDVLRACEEATTTHPDWYHVRLSGLRETWLLRKANA